MPAPCRVLINSIHQGFQPGWIFRAGLQRFAPGARPEPGGQGFTGGFELSLLVASGTAWRTTRPAEDSGRSVGDEKCLVLIQFHFPELPPAFPSIVQFFLVRANQFESAFCLLEIRSLKIEIPWCQNLHSEPILPWAVLSRGLSLQFSFLEQLNAQVKAGSRVDAVAEFFGSGSRHFYLPPAVQCFHLM